jgi:hypothetical protein
MSMPKNIITFRFPFRSSWVVFAPRLLFWSIAIAFLFPHAAKGAETKNSPQLENTQNTTAVETANNVKVSRRAADLIAVKEVRENQRSVSDPAKTVTFSAPDEVSHPQKLKKGHGRKQHNQHQDKDKGKSKSKSSSEHQNLHVPQSPEDVKIRDNQALSLEQVLAIAQRQNPELQVAILGLERSQAGLREAQAALYPNITLSGDITNSESASNKLSVNRGVATPQSDEAVTAFNGQAKFSYDIYTSGRRQATIRQAEEQLHFDKLVSPSATMICNPVMNRCALPKLLLIMLKPAFEIPNP